MGRSILCLLLCALAGACSEDEHRRVAPIELPPEPPEGREVRAEPEAKPDSSESAYRAVDVRRPGRIEGRVVWSGSRPAAPVLDVAAQHDVCGHVQTMPVLSVGRSGGVADAIVSLPEVTEGRPLGRPSEPVLVDQVACRYEPYVTAVPVGTPVTFRNSDDVLHNVHAIWEDGSDWFNVGQPREGMTTTQTPERVGVARLVCDAGHRWMLSWVRTFDHPYFDVTDAEGGFSLEGVPPGEHVVSLWHPGFEVKGSESGRPVLDGPAAPRKTVVVPPEGTVTVTFELPPPTVPRPAPNGR